MGDLKFYLDFLEGKSVRVYCGPRGERSEMAVRFLRENGIDASGVPPDELDEYEMEGEPMVVAINYLSVKPGHEEESEEQVGDLCMDTMDKEGFIGTKVVRATDISFGGSILHGDYHEIEIKPAKYIMLTYWKSREAHETFHEHDDIMQASRR